MNGGGLCCCICVHDDHEYLTRVLESFKHPEVNIPAVVFISRLAWDGSEGPYERTVEV